MDAEDDYQPHRYQSSDDEDLAEPIDKSVTLPKPTLVWRTPASTSSPSAPSISPSSPKKCSTLIIGTVFGGSALLLTIKAKTLLGTLLLPGTDLKDDVLLDQPARSNKSCNIYQLDADPTVVAIACNYEVKDRDSLNVAKAILSHFEASRIIILDTLSPATYLSGSPDIEYNYPWLRLLQTTGSSIETKIPTLEVPNLVQNLGAALMAYCEVRGLSNSYLLLSLQEHVYGKALITAATLRGLKEGLSKLGCPDVANQVDVQGAGVLLQDKRIGSNRMRDDRLYA